MSENITNDLPGGDGRSFEERVFARFDAMDTRFDALSGRLDRIETRFDARLDAMEERLAALEEKVDSRLRETRPIWEAVQATLEEIHFKLNELARDMLTMRARIGRLEERERTSAT